MTKVIYSKKDLETSLNEMKYELSLIPIERRSVKNWNKFRDKFKENYPKEAISWLDASAYITKWIKGE